MLKSIQDDITTKEAINSISHGCSDQRLVSAIMCGSSLYKYLTPTPIYLPSVYVHAWAMPSLFDYIHHVEFNFRFPPPVVRNQSSM